MKKTQKQHRARDRAVLIGAFKLVRKLDDPEATVEAMASTAVDELEDGDPDRIKVTQRGASKKEDAIDTAVFLEEVKSDRPSTGAEFKMSFTKLRGKKPSPLAQVLTLMDDADGRLGFMTGPVKAARHDALCRAILAEEGITQTELVPILKVTKSNVSRLVKEARVAGLVTREGPLALTGDGMAAAGGVF